jgi:hypothetical protein
MTKQRKVLLLTVLALGGAALAPAAALADSDPLAAVKTDVAKLQSDAQNARDTLVADANKLASDAQSLEGTTDRRHAIDTLKADRAQFKSDREAAQTTLRADRLQLRTDLKALRVARHASQGTTGGTAPNGELRALLQNLHSQLQQYRSDVRHAIEQARDAVKDLRGNFAKS